MNCYTCKFRRDIPGDAHSQCTIIPSDYVPFISKIAFTKNGVSTDTINVRLDPYGVENGWAMWPINFDPIWVEHCNLHREKE